MSMLFLVNFKILTQYQHKCVIECKGFLEGRSAGVVYLFEPWYM